MGMRQDNLVLSSTRKALQVRAEARVGSADALCIYDLASHLGLEVRMANYPSMEGMYCRSENPLIIVSSLRPAGRQVYTCAHELGHHVFGHGYRVDELTPDRVPQKRFDPVEFQADCFAGALLMPPTAINHAFHVRGWKPQSCTPEQALTIAGCFGVGYTTIIHHLSRAMHVLAEQDAERLLRYQVKQLRANLLGEPCDGDLYVVDQHWPTRPIDVLIGDRIILPNEAAFEGACVTVERQKATQMILRAVAQGCGRIVLPNESDSKQVRVSRRGYHGRCIYRHLEDDDAE